MVVSSGRAGRLQHCSSLSVFLAVSDPRLRAVLCAVLLCVLCCWAGGAIGKGKVERVCIIHLIPSHLTTDDCCQRQRLSSLQQPTYPTPPPPSCPQPSLSLPYSPPTHLPRTSCTAAVDTPPHLAGWLAGWLLACLLHLLRLRRGSSRPAPHHAITPTTQQHPPRHHSRSSHLRRRHSVHLRRTLTALVFTNTCATTALRATHIASHSRPAEPWHGPADGRQTARRGQADIARR